MFPVRLPLSRFRAAPGLAALIGLCTFPGLPAQASNLQAGRLAYSDGKCISSHYVMGPPEEDLTAFQITLGCNIALVEDYANQITLSQFGIRDDEKPIIGFVARRIPGKSSATHALAKVTHIILEQQRIPVKAGWCTAELIDPGAAQKTGKTASAAPTSAGSARWKESCVAWGIVKENGKEKKLLANINFEGSPPRILPPPKAAASNGAPQGRN